MKKLLLFITCLINIPLNIHCAEKIIHDENFSLRLQKWKTEAKTEAISLVEKYKTRESCFGFLTEELETSYNRFFKSIVHYLKKINLLKLKSDEDAKIDLLRLQEKIDKKENITREDLLINFYGISSFKEDDHKNDLSLYNINFLPIVHPKAIKAFNEKPTALDITIAAPLYSEGEDCSYSLRDNKGIILISRSTINSLYLLKKIDIDNVILFLLLHEKGHIENTYFSNLIKTIIKDTLIEETINHISEYMADLYALTYSYDATIGAMKYFEQLVIKKEITDAKSHPKSSDRLKKAYLVESIYELTRPSSSV